MPIQQVAQQSNTQSQQTKKSASQELRQKIWGVWATSHRARVDSPYYGDFDKYYQHVMRGLADNIELFCEKLGFK